MNSEEPLIPNHSFTEGVQAEEDTHLHNYKLRMYCMHARIGLFVFIRLYGPANSC